MDMFKDRKPDRRKQTTVASDSDTTYFTIPCGDQIVIREDRRVSSRRERKIVIDKSGETIHTEE